MKIVRKQLLSLWRTGIREKDPGQAIVQYLRFKRKDIWPSQFNPISEFHLVAIGKAAYTMAKAACRVSGRRMVSGLVIIPGGSKYSPLPRIRIIKGSHPLPTLHSLRAGRALWDFVHSTRHPLLFLISGGASSLAVMPRPDLSLNQKRKRIQTLMNRGLSIHKINSVRKTLSQIKGGKLIRGLSQPIASLIVSDVIGDRIETIASGLTVSTRLRANVRNHLILPCSAVATHIVSLARKKGFRTQFMTSPVCGIASAAGRQFAHKLRTFSRPCLVVGFGETTVRVRGRGRGGRNLEFALGAATEICKNKNITLLAISTDGVDGSSGSAGVFVDETTLSRAKANGLDPKRTLSENDTATFFHTLGDLVKSQPTGSNCADIYLAFLF